MDGMTESEPLLSSACCAAPDPYHLIRQCRVIGTIQNRKFNVPIKAGHGASHSTDFNFTLKVNVPRLTLITPLVWQISRENRRGLKNTPQ